MSGDVFGKTACDCPGHIKLVARLRPPARSSIPKPDAERPSFAERKKLFALPRSSGADYAPSYSRPAAACSRHRAKAAAALPGDWARTGRRLAGRRPGRAHKGDTCGLRSTCSGRR